jgi:hypothetical protein
MVRRAAMHMDCPFTFVFSGLIVALIMNTAATGIPVGLPLTSVYHLSDLVSQCP